MRLRLLVVLLASVLSASASTLTVSQLFAFMRSSADQMKEGKMTDRELASFLSKTSLSEKLDDRMVEELESLGLGPKTMSELRKLRDKSGTLTVAAPPKAPEKPVQPPPPTSIQQGALLDEVREYALAYSRKLPDFICTQHTYRYAAQIPVRRMGAVSEPEPSWQKADTLTIRLSYFNQKEDAKLVMINNTLTSQDYQSVGGATAKGVFGTMMLEIFERATGTRFEWERWANLRGRLSMVFGYKVSQARSQWHISYENRLDYVPAYHGLIYVDNKTHEITRITLEAEGLPAEFPVRSVSTMLDYDWVELSSYRFLLPRKSQTLIASDYMSKLEDQYVNYRKYQVETEMKFDIAPMDPMPDDKETPVTAAPPAEAKPAETKDPKKK